MERDNCEDAKLEGAGGGDGESDGHESDRSSAG